MRYRITIERQALKALAEIPKPRRRRIAGQIDALAEDPRPPGCCKLAGHDRIYRIRSGDYRILYEVCDDQIVVLILRIGHRKDVYRT